VALKVQERNGAGKVQLTPSGFFCDDCFERERQDERKNPEPVSDVWVWEFSFPKRSFLVIVFGGNRIGMSWS
jgi:hypothetical protein